MQVYGFVGDEAVITLNQLNQCQIRSISAAGNSAMSLIRMPIVVALRPMVALHHPISVRVMWVHCMSNIKIQHKYPKE